MCERRKTDGDSISELALCEEIRRKCMAKHYVKLWSGNFYVEVKYNCEPSKRKISTKKIRHKKRSAQEQLPLFNFAEEKLIKKTPQFDTQPRNINLKKTKRKRKKQKPKNLPFTRTKQSICCSCKNFDTENKLCCISKSDRGLVLHCLFFKL